MNQVFAPGKILLFGEYAVLEGWPALVVAVERYVTCRVSPYPELRIRSVGVDGHTTPISLNSPFLDGVVDELGTIGGDFLVDSSQFQTTEVGIGMHKLGLGSSAAATVAFTYALKSRMDPTNAIIPRDVFTLSQSVHRRIQGMGSGADIAASSLGGALRYRWADSGDELDVQVGENYLDCDVGRAGYRSLSEGLSHILVAWTGQSASTRALVSAVGQVRCLEQYKVLMSHIAESSEAGCEAWINNDYSGLRAAALQANEALDKLGQLAGVPLIIDGHRTIEALLASDDVLVKPTGAGGGDLAWILPKTPQDDDHILNRLKDAGIPAWKFPICSKGVHLA